LANSRVIIFVRQELRRAQLSPVYTSNTVKATGNNVEATFDFVAGVDWALAEGVVVSFFV